MPHSGYLLPHYSPQRLSSNFGSPLQTRALPEIGIVPIVGVHSDVVRNATFNPSRDPDEVQRILQVANDPCSHHAANESFNGASELENTHGNTTNYFMKQQIPSFF